VIRGAFVGAGSVALAGHLPAFRQDDWLRRNVRIVAAADESPENLAALEAELGGGVRTHRSVAALLEDGDFDFLDICAPPHVRLDVIREAGLRGCHLLCEKPLATSLGLGLEIRRELEGRPVVFMPCHQYRHAPLWREVIEQVGGGALGPVHVAQFEVLRTGPDPGSPHWHPGWRRCREFAGGGILFDMGTHYFYLLRTLFGPPSAITARTGCFGRERGDVEDTALVTLDYAGRLVHLTLSWAARQRENRFLIVGERGSLEWNGDELRREGSAPRTLAFAQAMAKARYPLWFAPLFRQFAQAVLDARPSAEPVRDAIEALRCAEAARASAACGRTIKLEEIPE
jgi:predicted dehydrogenase